MSAKILPTILIAIDIAASVPYAFAGERLQGFADGWTRPCFRTEDITDALVDQFVAIHLEWARINGKSEKPKSRKWVRKWLATISSPDCPDGPRYKAIGNSMSVNVMQWIGQRIQLEVRGSGFYARRSA